MNINTLKIKSKELINTKVDNKVILKCKELLVDCIDYIYDLSNIEKPSKASLFELINSEIVSIYINDVDLVNAMHYIRIVSVNNEHNLEIRKKDIKMCIDNIITIVGYLQYRVDATDIKYEKPLYMSEANTRKTYIDLYLNEAGWEVLDKENVIFPGKAGIEIKVEGMPNNEKIGFCDYVLYGRDGNPLAIVEAKKTSVDISVGRHQVDLYGECMKKKYGYKPILYYTNGYETKIIDGIYPDRKVMAFHTLEELELLFQRRERKSIVDIEKKINDLITNRPYQKIAITNFCETLNANNRRGLLVMATGTGKTRVAISLVDVLTKSDWIKNVLFLADRTALVNQAKRNFNKLLPNMSVCELSGNGEKDYNARLMFSTYQTMINYIDADDKRFSTGRFDLIIIDEAHRSIFNRYSSIFKYFDSLLVGLTATPRDDIDKNTYQIFDCEAGTPNFDYTLEEAINDHYLVGYKVINKTSTIISEGIDFSKLSEEERKQFDDLFDEDPPTPDFSIPGNNIFKLIYNKNTCMQVLEDLMNNGYRTNNGQKLGKSIVFAYNHKHAEMIVDCFREMYPDYPANTCQLIDYSVNYADDLILKFESDDEFRIAVSVDKLDTGVDIPSVLNLVFFKPVKSKIKFVQMIGRGTRLCDNIFGPGKDKNGFLIFDYCGNFEYFSINENGNSVQNQKSIAQYLFDIRIDLLHELQRLEYQEDSITLNYYQKTKNLIIDIVKEIKSHDKLISVRDEMKYVDFYSNIINYDNLTVVQIKEIKKHITHLVLGDPNEDDLSLAFDARILQIELDILTNSKVKSSTKHIKNVRKVTNYLLTDKASIPKVREKIEVLKTFISDQFWNELSIDKLEKAREELRDLMQYLRGNGPKSIDVDIMDNIFTSDFIPDDTAIDIRTYRQKVVDYLLENSNSKVIIKIKNLEPITNEDIKELEKVLWNDLGTKDEYEETTNITNLAAFIRSLVGLEQEAINKQFGEYLSGNRFNARQQEFIKTIITYVQQNGDISKEDLVNKAPFNNYDIVSLFGVDINSLVNIVNVLHNSIQVA